MTEELLDENARLRSALDHAIEMLRAVASPVKPGMGASQLEEVCRAQARAAREALRLAQDALEGAGQ